MKEMFETPGMTKVCDQGETACMTLELKETNQRFRDCMPQTFLQVKRLHSADKADPNYLTSEAFTLTSCSSDNCNTVPRLSCGIKTTGAPFEIFYVDYSDFTNLVCKQLPGPDTDNIWIGMECPASMFETD